MTPACEFYLKNQNNTITLVVNGEANLYNCYPLKAFIDEILLEKDKWKSKHFEIFLNTCPYMDSTFIGLLVYAGKVFMGLNKSLITIYTDANQKCIHQFLEMGLDKFFAIKEKSKPSIEHFIKLEGYFNDEMKQHEMVYNSHRDLSSVNENNRQKFKLALQLMEEELKNLKPRQGEE